MRLAGLSILGVALLVATAFWASPARADDKTPERFAVEGVADPAVLMFRPGADLPGKLGEMVLQQAYTDALYNISAYTRGIRFEIDFSGSPDQPPDVMKIFKKMEFQSVGAVLPEKKEYFVLQSQLTVGLITYGSEAVRRLGLREGLADLPAYVVVGEYHNARMPLLKTSLHWLAAKQCYLNAIMAHVAKTHGNRAILKAAGRVYPVRFLEAEVVPAPKPEPPPGEPGAEKPAEQAPAPEKPAAESAPKEPPATETPTEPAKADTPADDAGTGAAEPSKDAGEGAAKEPPKLWDSREFIYRLKMAVRVQLDSVEFAEPAPPDTAPAPQPPSDVVPGGWDQQNK